MEKLKIGLTYDLKSDWQVSPDEPIDANAEFDTPKTIDALERAFSKKYDVQRIGNVYQLMSSDLKVDAVFNIAEGRAGRNRESQVPIFLEMKKIPYIGSDSLTMGLTLDKIMAKKVFKYEGILTPNWIEFTDKTLAFNLNFPVIVKPRHEGSSKSLTKDSVCWNQEDAIKQANMILKKYHQPALIEEFISGQEFTVAILGNENPRALPVIQIYIDGSPELGEKFYDWTKIQSDSLEYICPPLWRRKQDKELEKRILDAALRTYNAVECKDFGRVDVRVDKDGSVYVLEINPLPGLNDVFITLAKAMNIEYEDLLLQILEEGLTRLNLIKGEK